MWALAEMGAWMEKQTWREEQGKEKKAEESTEHVQDLIVSESREKTIQTEKPNVDTDTGQNRIQ